MLISTVSGGFHLARSIRKRWLLPCISNSLIFVNFGDFRGSYFPFWGDRNFSTDGQSEAILTPAQPGSKQPHDGASALMNPIALTGWFRWMASAWLISVVLAATPLSARDLRFVPVASQTEDAGFANSNSEPVAGEGKPPMIYRCVKYAGKFHLLALHFPIALLLAAMFAQWRVVFTGRGGEVPRALLWSGALGAVVTAVLGWMYAYDSIYVEDDERILFLHRWIGSSAAVFALAILIIRKHLGPRSLAILLSLCAALVAAAAHHGASLAYGTDFFRRF